MHTNVEMLTQSSVNGSAAFLPVTLPSLPPPKMEIQVINI